MALNLIYPLICTEKLAESRDFYMRHFGFSVAFEADWYIHLTRGEADGRVCQIAFIDPAHDTIPAPFRRPTSGLVVSLEFDEVDGLYEAMREAGAPIALTLRDEAFGQRHFMSADPNGLLVDVIKLIPPAPEFLAQAEQAASAA